MWWPFPLYAAGAGLLSQKALMLAGLPALPAIKLLVISVAIGGLVMILVDMLAHRQAHIHRELLAAYNVVDFLQRREQLAAGHLDKPQEGSAP